MNAFLSCLEKYDLLIELIITILTVVLSLIAIFQTKNIAKRQLEQEENLAKQQADLQERQMKISVYQQKNEINKALNDVFDLIGRISILFGTMKVETLDKTSLYSLLDELLGRMDSKNISFTLEQSRFFMHDETFSNICGIRLHFLKITTSTSCLKLLNESEEIKNTIIEEIRNACAEIVVLQPLVESAMREEMKLE